jgi:hypothetical protein
VRFTGLAPRASWPFGINSRNISISVPNLIVCNDADVAIESCAKGIGLGAAQKIGTTEICARGF